MRRGQEIALLDAARDDSLVLGELVVDLLAALGGDVETAAAADTKGLLKIFPKGPKVKARTGDGREFLIEDPEAVVKATQKQGFHLPIDVDHGTEVFWGDDKSAYGWIDRKSLQVIDGAIYGAPEWNTAGESLLTDKRYRYLSPAMMVSRMEDSEVMRVDFFTSVALTNKPALRMRELASAHRQLNALLHSNRPGTSDQETIAMLKALLAALGLAETVTEQEALAAVQTLKSRPERLPSLDEFVPRADYDREKARAEKAETELAESATKARDAEVAAAVDAAVKAGKIEPAAKDFYVESCKAEGGLERFNAFVEKKAAVVTAEVTAPTEAPKSQDGSVQTLTADEVEAAAALGIETEKFAEHRKEIH